MDDCRRQGHQDGLGAAPREADRRRAPEQESRVAGGDRRREPEHRGPGRRGEGRDRTARPDDGAGAGQHRRSRQRRQQQRRRELAQAQRARMARQHDPLPAPVVVVLPRQRRHALARPVVHRERRVEPHRPAARAQPPVELVVLVAPERLVPAPRGVERRRAGTPQGTPCPPALRRRRRGSARRRRREASTSPAPPRARTAWSRPGTAARRHSPPRCARASPLRARDTPGAAPHGRRSARSPGGARPRGHDSDPPRSRRPGWRRSARPGNAGGRGLRSRTSPTRPRR